MRAFFLPLAAVAVASVAGCAAYDVQKVQQVKPAGTPFAMALTSEYRAQALVEQDNEHELEHAAIFARKGLAAAKGDAVAPEAIAAWSLPSGRVAELTDARAGLIAALDGGARERAPAAAAKAQTLFDCWIEEESEGEANSSCRADFLKIEPQLKAAQAVAVPPVSPAPEAAAHGPAFIVFFDFDKSQITPKAAQTIRDIAAAARQGKKRIELAGHADLSGSLGYDEKLSERRVMAVKQALVADGIPANQIDTSAFGKTKPRVPTKDGVREAGNRRVEVTLR